MKLFILINNLKSSYSEMLSEQFEAVTLCNLDSKLEAGCLQEQQQMRSLTECSRMCSGMLSAECIGCVVHTSGSPMYTHKLCNDLEVSCGEGGNDLRLWRRVGKCNGGIWDDVANRCLCEGTDRVGLSCERLVMNHD